MPTAASMFVAPAPSPTRSPPEISADSMDVGVLPKSTLPAPTGADRAAEDHPFGTPIPPRATLGGAAAAVLGGGGGGGAGEAALPVSQEESIARQYKNAYVVSEEMMGAWVWVSRVSLGVSGASAGGAAPPVTQEERIARQYEDAFMASEEMVGAGVGVRGVGAPGDVSRTPWPAVLPSSGFSWMAVGAAGVAQSAAAVAGQPVSGNHSRFPGVSSSERGGGAEREAAPAFGLFPTRASPAAAAAVAAAAAAAPALGLFPTLATPAAAAAAALAAAPAFGPTPAPASPAVAAAAAPAAPAAARVAAAAAASAPSPATTRGQASVAGSFFSRITRSQTARAPAESSGMDTRSTTSTLKRGREQEVTLHRSCAVALVVYGNWRRRNKKCLRHEE